jgi:ERCC4-type nuclease
VRATHGLISIDIHHARQRPYFQMPDCGFTILVDTAEQQPFEFKGLRADASQGGQLLSVPTRLQSLGRHPNSLGDYSMDGWFGVVAVERKAVSDFQGTILGWDGSRDRFMCELENLSALAAPMVVVEGSLHECLTVPEHRSTKDPETNAKILLRTVLGMFQDFHVPFLFCDSRRLAEIATFRFFERFWRKRESERKRTVKLLKSL